MLCFVLPSPYMEPPQGSYMTLDVEYGQGWESTVVFPNLQAPEELVNLTFPSGPFLFVPLTEESVLTTSLLNSSRRLPGVSTSTALLCSNRELQRMKLDRLDNGRYNVPWFPINDNVILKSGASTLNLGVEILSLKDKLDKIQRRSYIERGRLRQFTGKLPQSIIEQYVEGMSVEVSGVVANEITFFNTLKQTWTPDHRISQYEKFTDDEELKTIARKIVGLFDMNYCGFCIEFKGPPWKVIEVHCRIGEDSGEYYNLLTEGENPVQILYNEIIGKFK